MGVFSVYLSRVSGLDEFVIGTGEDVVFDDEIVYSEDDLFIGDSENPKGEDSISWDELS